MHVLVSGLSLLFQASGGATVSLLVGTILVQTQGGVSLDPALAAAYGAIGALFGLVTWLAKGRIERCEGREDKLLTADADKTATIRELSTGIAKVGDTVTSIVAALNSNGQRIEQLTTHCNTENREMRNAVDALARRVDEFTQQRNRQG